MSDAEEDDLDRLIRERLVAALRRKGPDGLAMIDLVVEGLIERAINRDIAAIREVFDRVTGKPAPRKLPEPPLHVTVSWIENTPGEAVLLARESAEAPPGEAEADADRVAGEGAREREPAHASDMSAPRDMADAARGSAHALKQAAVHRPAIPVLSALAPDRRGARSQNARPVMGPASPANGASRRPEIPP